MKKLFLLFAIVLFCSCNNDDNHNSSQNQLKGKWSLINKSKNIQIISLDSADTTTYNLLYIDKTTLKLSIENDTILNSTKYFTYERSE